MAQRIEPMQYRETKNIDEHRQIVGKVNEVIDQLNLIGEVPPNVGDRLDIVETVATRADNQATANANEIMRVEDSALSAIADVDVKVNANTDQIAMHDTDLEALSNETVDRLALDLVGGKALKVDIIRGSGETQTGNGLDLPFMDTATLVPGLGDFTFKLDMVFKDGSHIVTNDMVLPSGGSESVPIAGVIIKAGSTPSKFIVAVVLENGTTIDSNEYNFPDSIDAYTKKETDSKLGHYIKKDDAVNAQEVTGRVDFKLAPFVPDVKEGEKDSQRPMPAKQVYAELDADRARLTATEGVANGAKATAEAIGVINSIGGTADAPTLKTTVNGKSSTVNLPAGGGKPKITNLTTWEEIYDAFVNASVGDVVGIGNISFWGLGGRDVTYKDIYAIRTTYNVGGSIHFSVMGMGNAGSCAGAMVAIECWKGQGLLQFKFSYGVTELDSQNITRRDSGSNIYGAFKITN